MSVEASKKAFKTVIQSTLNFPILFTKDNGREKFKISTKNSNYKETQKVTVQQTLFDNFIKNTNKRKIEDIVSSESENEDGSDEDESNENGSDDDGSNDDGSDDGGIEGNESSSFELEYKLHDDLVNFPPNICDDEKKLRHNKFFFKTNNTKTSQM